MIKRVFIDTDIILDVALAREPFLQTSKKVLSLLEHGSAAGFISSNEVANLYYILRKIGGREKTKVIKVTKVIFSLTD